MKINVGGRILESVEPPFEEIKQQIAEHGIGIASSGGFGEAVQHLSNSELMWQWATAHPYLHTFIEVATPSITLLILIAGGKLLITILDYFISKRKQVR